jgi:hypothetical protein
MVMAMNLKSPIPTVLIPVFLVAAIAAAGCGGSSSASTTTTTSQDAARVKFAQCLRDNGVDVPDNPGQNGGGGPPRNIDQSKFQAALKACQKYRQAAIPNLSQSQQQEFRDAFTKFASCMRQHGVELPDPGAGGGPPAGGNRINQNDPKVQTARKACQDKLPQGGPGGGFRGGPPGGQGN